MDDFHLSIEGETHIVAFCPNIKNADRHKAFAIKYWIDAKLDWPVDAENKVGTPHQFKSKLTKASSGAPMSGYLVRWTLEDGGPEGYLNSPGQLPLKQSLIFKVKLLYNLTKQPLPKVKTPLK